MQGMQQSLFDSQAHVVEGHRFCTKYETFRFFLPADSLKFYPIILTKNSHFFKNLLLIVWVFCLIVLLHRITELKNARSSIFGVEIFERRSV